MKKNILHTMNSVRKSMRVYGPSLNEIPSVITKLAGDEHFRFFLKGDRLRAGFNKQTVVDITFHNQTVGPIKTISLTNVVRDHYDFCMETRTYGIAMFVAALASSGWRVIEGSIADQENHVSTRLYNEKTHLSAECHFSLSALNLLTKENNTPTFFSDFYPEID